MELGDFYTFKRIETVDWLSWKEGGKGGKGGRQEGRKPGEWSFMGCLAISL